MRYRTIILLAALLIIPVSASDAGSRDNSRASEGLALSTSTQDEKSTAVLSWSPQVVSYVYVNDTEGRTIGYSITTSLPMEANRWTLDGVPVGGAASKNTVSYMHTWDSKSAGFHTLAYRGTGNRSEVAFSWYVNVYDTEQYRGGNLFDVFDEVLENHSVDIKIRMLKYTISKHGSKSNLTIERVNRLYDEIARQQGSDENLRPESLRGEAGMEEYIPSMKKAQRNAKYRAKLAKEIIKIAREDMGDGRLAMEFRRLYDAENYLWEEQGDNNGTDKGEGREQNKSSSPESKGKYDNSTGGVSVIKSKDLESSQGHSSGSGGDPVGSGGTGSTGDSENTGMSGENKSQKGSGSSGNKKDAEDSGSDRRSEEDRNKGNSGSNKEDRADSEKYDDSGNNGDPGNSKGVENRESSGNTGRINENTGNSRSDANTGNEESGGDAGNNE